MKTNQKTIVFAALVCAAIQPLHADTLVVDVPTGEDRDLTADEAANAQANKVSEIIKTGGGTWTPSSATTLSGYTGQVTVREGYYKITAMDAQPSASRVVVEDGATLWVHGTNKAFTISAPISFQGNGVGGTAGAIRYEGFATGDGSATRATMTGDALIYLNTTRPWRFDNSVGLDMAGHKMTVNGPSSGKVSLVLYCPVLNPGTIEMMTGSFRPGYGYRLTEGGTLILHDTAQIDLYKFGSHSGQKPDDFPWTVRTAWTKTPMTLMTPFRGSADNTNHVLRCPIVLNGGYTNTVTGFLTERTRYRRLSGDISGEGALNLEGSGQFLHFAGTNTMTGNILVKNGACVLENPAAVPGGDYRRIELLTKDYSFLLASPKSAAVPNGYEAADALGFFQTMQTLYGGNGCNYFIYPQETEQEIPGTLEIDRLANPNGLYLRVYGGSAKFRTRFLNGPSVFVRPYFSNTDRVIMTAPEDGEAGALDMFNVELGILDMTGLGTVVISNDCKVGGTASSPARLRVGAGTALVQACPRWASNKDIGTYIGAAVSTYHRGIVEVLAGGVMTNTVFPARGDKSVGALYLRKGGSIFSTAHPGWDLACPLAVNAESYIEIDGGDFSTGNGLYLSGSNTGLGVMYMKGGTFVGRADFWGCAPASGHGPHIGREGTGVVYQCGGTLTSPGTIWIGSSNWREPEKLAKGAKSEYTIDGTGTVARVGTATYLMAKSFCTGSLNLIDGGALETATLFRPLTQPCSANDGLNHILSNRTAYVSFNGGILRANADSESWLGATDASATYSYYTDPAAKTGKTTKSIVGSTCPDYVTVYARGAILDSSNKTVTVQASLVRPPSAGGIASITIPGNGALTGYLAPPVVDIAGDGEGASAVALFDSVGMKVTGVKVTSPGWGYTAEKTRVTLRHGSYRPNEPVVTNMAFTVAENAPTGGLTVRGSGVVTLAAANTYGGATTIEGGTLRIARAEALPAGTEIRLAGGMLDMNGNALPAGCKVSLVDPQNLVRNGVKMKLMANLFGSVKVENASELPVGWGVRQSGTSLYLKPEKGFLLIIR